MSRLYIAGAVTLLGLILAALALFDGQPVTALSLALAAIYCGLGVLVGVGEVISNPSYHAAAAIIGGIGLIAVFLYNRGFDIKLQEAHAAAFEAFSHIEMNCTPMSIDIRNVSEFGIKACALQPNADQMSATLELAKGLHYGPTLSLANAANTATGAPAKDFCATAYKVASAMCPTAFSSLSEAHRSALLGALK